MATLREAALRTADVVRSLTAPAIWDYRTVAVRIIRRVWAGGEAGADGGFVDTTLLQLPQIYRVEELSERFIANSGGRYEIGAVKVGPITPSYTIGALTGGVTSAQLDPAPTTAAIGTELIYVLSGALSGEYRLVNLHQSQAVSYYAFLNRLRTTP